MEEIDPYEPFDSVPSFAVTSTDVSHGELLARVHRSSAHEGSDLSPQMSWRGFPQKTASFAVTCFDPDAPTGSGFWHWAVYNIPGTVTDLEQGAGSPGGALPARARMLKNEYRRRQYSGAEPPGGTGEHRYIFAVHAVDVGSLDIDPESTPAVLGFTLHFHTLARGLLIARAAFDDDVK